MIRPLAVLTAMLALAAGSPAEAQRAPLLGIWFGPIQCGPTGGRHAKLFMYGDGTGLLELGVSPFTPQLRPAVAMVSLRQPPEADVVLIDQWVSNGVEPRPQLAGQVGPDGFFSGRVLNDAHCDRFSFSPQRFSRFVLRDMARAPVRTAQREATMLDPHITLGDAAKMGLIGGVLTGFIPLNGFGRGGRGGGGGAAYQPPPSDDYDYSPAPSVGGNIHGNGPTDIQGNLLTGRMRY